MRLSLHKLLIVSIAVGLSPLVAYSDLFGSSLPPKIVVYPAETSAVLNNPYTGWVADARDSDIAQPVRLAHANAYWRDLEPSKGQFDFAAFETANQFEQWRQKGVKIVLRIVLDYPSSSKHMDIPEWLYKELKGRGDWYDLDIGQGFSPDYTQPILIQYHNKLLKALGDRYDNDPLIAFVELGSIGHWGEWHTWDEEPNRIPFPKRSITDQYAAAYVRYFRHKPLMMRRPHQIALENGMGLFNDAFGKTDATIDEFLDWYTSGYVSWLTGEKEPPMPDFWAKAPSGGEFSDPDAYLKDARIEETLRQAKLTHVSWMGPSAPVQEPVGGTLQRNMDRFLNAIGYRFVLSSVAHEQRIRPGERLHTEIRIVNRGVAPFYFPWKTQLSLWDENENQVANWDTVWDIRSWLPGETLETAAIAIPQHLPQGAYTLRIAVIDPETEAPGIQFANEGGKSDGRYDLSTVQIE